MTLAFILLLLFLVVALGGALVFAFARILNDRERLQQFAELGEPEAHKKKLQDEVETLQTEAEKLKRSHAEHQQKIATMARQLDPLSKAIDLKRATEQLASTKGELEQKLAALQKDFASVEESLNIQSFGLYRPRYSFSTSTEYQQKLEAVRARQTELIKTEQAAHCPNNWTVDGSVAKGKKMIAEHAKLMLRAFNGECEAAIAKVKYNNVVTLEARIKKSFDAINKLGQSKMISITQEYLLTALDELHVAHELQEKVHAEREEQRAIKEQIREEERAQRELEEAQAKAEREATLREEALERARKELLESTGRQHEKLEQLVTKLELELKEAIDTKAKAIARAQLTKSGHVYVISNIGSFGEGCFKIGMTRRLDPMERVWELGSASVPFEFDVHAMIFSENAPELETALHRKFDAKRVNRANVRKEFFRVTLEEIQVAVKELHGQITFVTVPEAEEYRKTLVMEQAFSLGEPAAIAAAPGSA